MTGRDEITARLGIDPDEVDGRARWWLHDVAPDDADATAAVAALGLVEVRRLHQMRRPLPIDPALREATTPIVVRSFDPSSDVEQWLSVNNGAFDFHPDQGGWTAATLRTRMTEDWFDLDDFLVHDGDDAAIDGFCWTKVHRNVDAAHRDRDPLVGEIYVIAAAPRRHGTGLGRSLVVAGLDHLWNRHRTPVGMLYVEADNEPALRLYQRLGFEVASDDIAFEEVST